MILLRQGELNVNVRAVISNNSNSLALERAKKAQIPCYHLSSKHFSQEGELDIAIYNILKENMVDTIILAGYMKKLGKKVLESYKGRILNIHPALLPKFGGKGMYGNYIHEAVLAAKETKTGVTIHIVDEEYDTGKIINQCEIEIFDNDTVESLSKRVLEREHIFYVKTLQMINKGEIIL